MLQCSSLWFSVVFCTFSVVVAVQKHFSKTITIPIHFILYDYKKQKTKQKIFQRFLYWQTSQFKCTCNLLRRFDLNMLPFALNASNTFTPLHLI
jgi:hypothetical protein